MSENKPIKVPVDNKTGRVFYNESDRWYRDISSFEMRENWVFEDQLEFTGFGTKNKVMFKSLSDGNEYQAFLTEFASMIPHMTGVLIYGKFTFIKRCRDYGIKLVSKNIY